VRNILLSPSFSNHTIHAFPPSSSS
jgi:hypothetical protein